MIRIINREITEAVDRVYAVADRLVRGQVLTNDAVAAASGLRPGGRRWHYVLRLVGRRLEREKGISFWPNTEGGRLLCTAEQQLMLVPERMRRGARQVNRGARQVSAIRPHELTANQRLVQDFMARKARRKARSLFRESTAALVVAGSSERTPRRAAGV